MNCVYWTRVPWWLLTLHGFNDLLGVNIETKNHRIMVRINTGRPFTIALHRPQCAIHEIAIICLKYCTNTYDNTGYSWHALSLLLIHFGNEEHMVSSLEENSHHHQMYKRQKIIILKRSNKYGKAWVVTKTIYSADEVSSSASSTTRNQPHH